MNRFANDDDLRRWTVVTGGSRSETVHAPNASRGAGGARRDLLALSPAKRAQRVFLRALSEVAPRYALQVAFHHFTRPRRRSVYRAEALPGGAVPFTLPFRRSRLRGYVWGAGETTVYLVHGWESHLARMAGFVEPIVAAGFRVVAFDAPGHGRSGMRSTHVGDIRAALGAVVAHFGAPHAFVAHSYGAAATALLLRESPEIRPAALALIAPMTSLRIHLELFAQVAQLTPRLQRMLTARLEERLGMEIDAADVGGNVRDLGVRGLLVHDRHDDVIPFGAAARVASSWRGAGFLATTGLGHRTILRDAEVVRRVAAFVAGDRDARDIGPAEPAPEPRRFPLPRAGRRADAARGVRDGASRPAVEPPPAVRAGAPGAAGGALE